MTHAKLKMAAPVDGNQNLSIKDAKAAIKDILLAFEQGDNATKIRKAKESAGNDMLKMMQIVFPLTVQIEREVVKKYGFSSEGEGVIQFASAVKSLSAQDSELAELNTSLRNFIIPQMEAKPPVLSTQSSVSSGAS